MVTAISQQKINRRLLFQNWLKNFKEKSTIISHSIIKHTNIVRISVNKTQTLFKECYSGCNIDYSYSITVGRVFRLYYDIL